MTLSQFRRRLFSAGLILVALASVAAQDTPDFSGRWVLVSPSDPAPDIPRVMSVRQLVVRTNVRGEPMTPFVKELTVERELADGTRTETYRPGIIGGTAPGSGGGPHHHHHHQTIWDGRALVMEQGTSSGPDPRSGEWSERREVWRLDDEGRLNVVITIRGAAVDSRRVTLVYRRE